MEILFGWFLLSVGVAILAGRYGRNGAGWFILALLISPLIAAVLVLALGPVPRSAAAESGGLTADFRKCPRCAEPIRAEAKVCRFCGHEFPGKVAAPTAARQLPREPDDRW